MSFQTENWSLKQFLISVRMKFYDNLLNQKKVLYSIVVFHLWKWEYCIVEYVTISSLVTVQSNKITQSWVLFY